MVDRQIKLPKHHSFFLFGARGTGKSSLLKSVFEKKKTLWIDLLNEDVLEKYLLRPQALADEISILKKGQLPEWVVIDEVQKAPRILNVVHQLIESTKKIKFALTGSSARRLKQKGVNLLAGRAWVESLYPLTFRELGKQFDLTEILKWGSLPKCILDVSKKNRIEYLRAYTTTYIKTEVQEEQWVRKIEPFRAFLPVAAQMNGQPLNYTNISRDIGVDVTTIQAYYQILEETLLGFFIPSYHKSIRKQQRQASKFYFFDNGVKHALERRLSVDLSPQTSEFGSAFESYVICELVRSNQYLKKDFEFSYLRTKDDLEIDIVIDRPGKPTALVEIKSKTKVDERDTRHLERIHKDFKNTDCFLLSLDPIPKKIGAVKAFPWQQCIEEIGL